MNHCDKDCTGRTLTEEERNILHMYANPYSERAYNHRYSDPNVRNILDNLFRDTTEFSSQEFTQHGIANPQKITTILDDVRLLCQECPYRKLPIES